MSCGIISVWMCHNEHAAQERIHIGSNLLWMPRFQIEDLLMTCKQHGTQIQNIIMAYRSQR